MVRGLIISLLLASSAYGQGILSGIMSVQPAAAAGGTWTFRGKSINKSCATSGSTCSVTISPAILGSSLLIINAWPVNEVSVVSISVGGTLVPLNSLGGTSATTYHTYGYVTSASATSGPVVITFSGTTGGGDAEVREYTTGGGTPVLDIAGAIYAPYSASPIVAPSYTLTGSSDVLVQTENNDHAVTTACASPWNTNTNFDATNGPGFCDHVATSSGTGASFTSSPSGNYVAAGMGFGFGISACSYSSVDDHSGGTNGAALTISPENSSTFATLSSGGWTASASTSGLLYDNSHGVALVNPIRVCGTGTTKGGSSAMGVSYLDSLATLQNMTWTMNPGPNGSAFTNWAVGFYWSTTCTGTVCGNGGIWAPVRMISQTGKTVAFEVNGMVDRMETDSGTTNGSYTLSANTVYWVTLLYAAGGTHTLKLYNSTGSTLLDTITRAATGGSDNPYQFQFGRTGEPGTTTNHDYFGNIKFCDDGTFPCLP